MIPVLYAIFSCIYACVLVCVLKIYRRRILFGESIWINREKKNLWLLFCCQTKMAVHFVNISNGKEERTEQNENWTYKNRDDEPSVNCVDRCQNVELHTKG